VLAIFEMLLVAWPARAGYLSYKIGTEKFYHMNNRELPLVKSAQVERKRDRQKSVGIKNVSPGDWVIVNVINRGSQIK
jgi:hypothetical protein